MTDNTKDSLDVNTRFVTSSFFGLQVRSLSLSLSPSLAPSRPSPAAFSLASRGHLPLSSSVDACYNFVKIPTACDAIFFIISCAFNGYSINLAIEKPPGLI